MRVEKFNFHIHGDESGNLIALESNKNVPFDIKRVYYIWGTQQGIVRGKHAHIDLRQILVPVHGSCEVDLEYGEMKETFMLSDPTQGLYIEGLVWREIRTFSHDSVLMVLADRVYHEGDYIRSYQKFLEMKNSPIIGEKMTVFIHPLSDTASRKIGEGTKVWQYCIILAGADIGKECNIGNGTIVENDVLVGDRVTVKGGSHLCDGVTLENDVFIGAGVHFNNDKYPKSGNHNYSLLRTHVGTGASIGANTVILPGVTIGANAIIGAGSVVTHNIPANEIWYGNPARKRGERK